MISVLRARSLRGSILASGLPMMLACGGPSPPTSTGDAHVSHGADTAPRDIEFPAPVAGEGGVMIVQNQGGRFEGHTPRGFSGQGTGIFIGDNINAKFPDGDGVQVYLTFDLSAVEPQAWSTATLRANTPKVRGTPFDDLGPLQAWRFVYDDFGKTLFDQPSLDGPVTFAESAGGPFEADVTAWAKTAIAEHDGKLQIRLLFETAGDGDGEPDGVYFNHDSADENRAGLLEVVLAP